MRKKSEGTFRVGTSNIVLPVTKQHFPEAFRSSSRLCYYSSLFATLEINSTFYKLPLPSTFARWASEVTPDFKFTVKLSKEITHGKELVYEKTVMAAFMKAACLLGNKKDCLLIQFPGKITIGYFDKVLKILKELSYLDPVNSWRKCVEFRHKSWYQEKTYLMLENFQSSLVLHDIPASKNIYPTLKGGVVYIRFHGTAGDYRGNYPDGVLMEYAAKIKRWIKEGRDVYAYFNNTLGDAFNDAVKLNEMVNGDP